MHVLMMSLTVLVVSANLWLLDVMGSLIVMTEQVANEFKLAGDLQFIDHSCSLQMKWDVKFM